MNIIRMGILGVVAIYFSVNHKIVEQIEKGEIVIIQESYEMDGKPSKIFLECDTNKLEDKVVQKIFSLPEIKAKNRFVDSLTNHKSGISVIISGRPNKEHKYYWI